MGKSTNRTTSQRILWIDIARGLAILMIVMSHVIRKGILTDYLGSVGVVMFFFLGGITFRCSGKEFREFWCSRLRKLYLPYLAVGTFSILCYALLGNVAAGALGIDKGDNHPARAFLHLLYANSKNGCMKWNDSLWFIPAYLVVLVLASIIEALCAEHAAANLNKAGADHSGVAMNHDAAVTDHIDLITQLIIRLIIGAGFLILGYFLTQRLDAHLPWQIETACEMLIFFEAGIAYGKIEERCSTANGTRITGGVLLLACSAALIGVSAVLTAYDSKITENGLITSMGIRADVYPNFLLSYFIFAIAIAAFCLFAQEIELFTKMQSGMKAASDGHDFESYSEPDTSMIGTSATGTSAMPSYLARLGRCSMAIMLWNKFFVLAAQIALKKAATPVYGLVNKQTTPAALILSIPVALLCAEGCIYLDRIIRRTTAAVSK